MAREIVPRGRSLMDLPLPHFMRWPAHWTDLFDLDELIRVEEVTEGDTLVVRAELPGVDPDKDVELTVDSGYLTIRAERHEEKEEKGRQRHRTEFRYGSFTRTLPLPEGATEDDVKATFENGILEVRIPVQPPKGESRKISILKV